MSGSSKVQKFINARLMAVQAVYAQAFTGEAWNKIVSGFLLGEAGGKVILETDNREEEIFIEEADAGLFTRLAKEVETNKENLHHVLASIMGGKVDFDKLDLLLQSILYVGVAEFFVNQELDKAIIVNEYVDMTRAFYNGSEPSMVNVVLDSFASTVR